MLVKAGVVIDFGNSETRAILIAGGKKYRFNLPNKFVALTPGYKVSKRYINNKSYIFLVGENHYANGTIVDMEFNRTAAVPAVNTSKAEQQATLLTVNLVFIRCLELLSQAYNVGVESLEVTFDVSVLMPPLDHEKNEKLMEDKIRSVTSVSLLAPRNFVKNISLGEVTVYSEGVAAFLGAFYTEQGVIRVNPPESTPLEYEGVRVTEFTPNSSLVEVESNRPFMQGYVLVLDIGAGTTDVALFKDMELLESSKDSFNIGGNQVVAHVGKSVRLQKGFLPPSVQDVVLTGVLSEGSVEHDFSKYVTEAKNQYALAALPSIHDYVVNLAVDLPVIKGLLVVGGGAMPSVRNGVEVSPSMGSILIDYLKQHSPNMKLLDTSTKILRDLNVEGVYYIHKYS